jgi:Family of unknown function (DUF6069)
MTRPEQPIDANRPSINARTLWAGGAATALVAALVALVGVVIFRGIFEISVLAPEREGVWVDATTGQLMALAAIAALAATALLHLLLISTPRALSFFGWIVGLVTVALMLAPFATGEPLDTKIATAAIYLVIGLAIISLLSGVARNAVSRPRPNRHPDY